MDEYSITVKVDEKQQTATVVYREGDKLVGRINVEPPDQGKRGFKVIGAGGAQDMAYSPTLRKAIRLAIVAVVDDIAERY